MTTTDIAVREANQTVVLDNTQLKYISTTEFVPQGLRGNMPAILACVATGRSLGLSDMTALRSIHVINGRASFSAELMVMLVRRAGHSIQGEVTDGSATVTGKRADNGDTMTYTFTAEMAQRAGLSGNASHKKYPESMLWARAVSQLCRMLFADCFAGVGTYTAEEIGSVDEADGEFAEAAFDDQPVVGSESSAPGLSELGSGADHLTEPQERKLNVLVGTLREQGHITTEQLWRAVGREPVASEDGELHWSPLRESLTVAEASSLIERLGRLKERVGAGV